MYRNKPKIIIIIAVFSLLFAGCAFIAVVMLLDIILVLTHQIPSYKGSLSLPCYMLATFSLFSYLSFKKIQKAYRANKMSQYFEQDSDGLISMEALAIHMKMKRHKCFALFLDCIGRNLLKNCTVFSEDPTYLILDNGKKTIAEKFVVKHCPKCSAPSTLRIGYENTCKYCGTVVMENSR